MHDIAMRLFFENNRVGVKDAQKVRPERGGQSARSGLVSTSA